MKSNRVAFGQGLIIFLIYLVVSLSVHEYGHMVAMRILGFEGYISSNWMSAVQWVEVPAEGIHRFYVGVAGGIAVAWVFAFLYLFDVDREDKFVFLILGGSNLVYSGFEGLSLMALERSLIKLGSNLSNIYIVVMFALFFILKWFRRD